MRILSIFTSFTNGGAEILVSNLSGAFAQAGHRSTVAALSRAAAVGNDPATERAICERIAGEGGHPRILALRRRGNLPAGALAVRRLIAEERPDVIHAHTARALPMLWLAGARCPVVLTHHNSRLSFPPLLFRLFDRIVDRYVAISHDCERMFGGHANRPVTQIVNAAGAGFLATAGRTAPADPATILAVGALTEQKNYAMLIEAAAHLRHRCGARHRFHLRIAGDGALMASLRQRIAALQAGPFVELLGNRSDVADLMRGADIFVNSSHYEGMPIAMLEALQSALPVVATDVAGSRELITTGRNGLLARPDDPEALAVALFELLSQPDLYRRMSAAALDEGRRYDLGTCACAHLAMYRQLLRPVPERPARAALRFGRVQPLAPRAAKSVQRD
ncbi:glycosyltransferase [Stakelama saccharophila]|uniref:Glycosyltransferase n=1 Tax=Stakelama saccharophila TaxID=3075605 RepID=A0ABZ0BA85_9SPHN|nr:glycosyltransferase [Stakelama sp. W311]WNO54195.1 glycosyltransferase [Stakelama sp. W311]